MHIHYLAVLTLLSSLPLKQALAEDPKDESWQGLAVARLELASPELRKEFGKPVQEFTVALARELTLYTWKEDIAVPGLWTIWIVTGRHKDMGLSLAVYKQRVADGSRKELLINFPLAPGSALDVPKAVKDTMDAFIKNFPKNRPKPVCDVNVAQNRRSRNSRAGGFFNRIDKTALFL